MKKILEKNTRKKLFFIKKWPILTIFLIFFIVFCVKSSHFFNFLDQEFKYSPITSTKPAFYSGEKLKYKISYGKKNKSGGAIFAAHATLHVKDSIINDTLETYSISAFGKTTRLFSLFMKVQHYYYTCLEKNSFRTLESNMIIREGKYQNSHHVKFNNSIKDTSDILGVFYRLRNTPNTTLNNTDTIFFSYYYNNTIYNSHIINLGKDIIQTKFGKINTIKSMPLVEKGRVFKEQTGTILWVSDDQMHIPIKLEIPILIGSLYVNLSSYENVILNLKE